MDKWEIKQTWKQQEIDELLEKGWEPYAVTADGTEKTYYFRRKIYDQRAKYWQNYLSSQNK